jgi:hypothetical protein
MAKISLLHIHNSATGDSHDIYGNADRAGEAEIFLCIPDSCVGEQEDH